MASQQRKKAKAKAPAKKVAAPRKRTPKVAKVPVQTAQPVSKRIEFPALAHVIKGADKIPVTLADQVHLDRLIGEHGAGGVEVQS